MGHRIIAGFHSLWLDGQKVHTALRVPETKEMDVTRFVGEVDDESLGEELQTC